MQQASSNKKNKNSNSKKPAVANGNNGNGKKNMKKPNVLNNKPLVKKQNIPRSIQMPVLGVTQAITLKIRYKVDLQTFGLSPTVNNVIITIAPTAACLGIISFNTAVTTVAPVITPIRCPQVVDAVKAFANQVGTSAIYTPTAVRWSKLCVSVIDTTPLASVGNLYTALRSTQPFVPTFDATLPVDSNLEFNELRTAISQYGQSVTSATASQGVCIELCPTNIAALDFQQIPYNAVDTDGNALTNWKAAYALSTSTTINRTTNGAGWAPVIIDPFYIGRSSAYTAQLLFEGECQIVVNPNSWAYALGETLPIGTGEQFMRTASKRLTEHLWMRSAATAPMNMARNPAAYLGV